MVLGIMFFLQYFKIIAYLENRYIYGTALPSIGIPILIFVGIPLSYFSAKILVKLIRKLL